MSGTGNGVHPDRWWWVTTLHSILHSPCQPISDCYYRRGRGSLLDWVDSPDEMNPSWSCYRLKVETYRVHDDGERDASVNAHWIVNH